MKPDVLDKRGMSVTLEPSAGKIFGQRIQE